MEGNGNGTEVDNESNGNKACRWAVDLPLGSPRLLTRGVRSAAVAALSGWEFQQPRPHGRLACAPAVGLHPCNFMRVVARRSGDDWPIVKPGCTGAFGVSAAVSLLRSAHQAAQLPVPLASPLPAGRASFCHDVRRGLRKPSTGTAKLRAIRWAARSGRLARR